MRIQQGSVTYLRQYLLGCQAPRSMAPSLALTGKSRQVWKLGVLLTGEEEKKVSDYSRRRVLHGTKPMAVNSTQSLDGTNSQTWQNLGTKVGSEK